MAGKNRSILFVLPLALLLFQGRVEAKDPLFSDDFESGNLSAWDKRRTDSGDLAVTAGAALERGRGLRVRIDDNSPIFVGDDTPNGENSYKAKFLFDPNSIRMTKGNSHTIFLGQDLRDAYVAALRVDFRKVAAGYQLRAGARKDDLTWVKTPWFAIADQSHEIEVEWDASESEGMDNGQLTFYIDSIKKDDLIAIDNDTFRIDRVRLGAVSGIDATTRGVYFFDLFESFD